MPEHEGGTEATGDLDRPRVWPRARIYVLAGVLVVLGVLALTAAAPWNGASPRLCTFNAVALLATAGLLAQALLNPQGWSPSDAWLRRWARTRHTGGRHYVLRYGLAYLGGGMFAVMALLRLILACFTTDAHAFPDAWPALPASALICALAGVVFGVATWSYNEHVFSRRRLPVGTEPKQDDDGA